MPLTKPIRLAILTIFVLGIYYPTLSGSPNSIDDYKMLMDFELTADFNLRSLFIPGTTFYYRPLIGLSFIIDKALWQLEPSFMLLENVFLQLLSALLVLSIAKKAKLEDNVALVSSLVFAAHPLATESINWISGRTDLMATFFHLLCVYLLIMSVENKKRALMPAAFVAFCCGVLSKEMSVIFLVVDGLILLQWPSSLLVKRPLSRRVRDAAIFTLPIFFGGCLLLVYRSLVFGDSARGFSFLFNKLGMGLFDALLNAIAIFGFYAKKLLVPVPLNFAIAEINPHYLWLGLLLLPVISFLLIKNRQLPATLLAYALLLLAPAVALGLFNIAWTPFAERYAYMATPFFAIGIIGVAHNFLRHRFNQNWAAWCFYIPLILIGTTVTIQRNILWQDKFDLYEDAVRQSPRFATVRNALAQEYLRKGKKELAVEHLLYGITLDRQKRNSRNHILYVTLARLKMDDGDLQGAEEILNEGFSAKKETGTPELLVMLARLIQIKYNQAEENEKKSLADELLSIYALLYQKTGNPFYHYTAGKIALSQNDIALAKKLFRLAAEKAPTGTEYKKPALLLADTLGSS